MQACEIEENTLQSENRSELIERLVDPQEVLGYTGCEDGISVV
jgi:hypothetical protein